MAVNVIGGLYMGVFEYDLPIGEAADIFTRLTIGDGLVSQVPAFLVSLAAGLIVTRSSSDSDLRGDVVGQTFRHPEALFLAAGFLAAMSFTGLPTVPLLAMAAGCVTVGVMLRKALVPPVEKVASSKPVTEQKPQQKLEDHLRIDPMELTIGGGLVTFAQNGNLLSNISDVRSRIAQELGMLLPKIRVKDNIQMPAYGYEFKMRGIPVATGEARIDRLLAVRTSFVTGELAGQRTVEPATGHAAMWIDPAQRDRAELLGYLVQNPTDALFSHLHEVVREHAAELLTRQQVHALLDNLRQTSPKVVDELIPGLLKPAQVHLVLENLLRERVPIRDLEAILETLADHAEQTKNLILLTEYVRAALARTICQRHRDSQRVLRVLTLDPDLEDVIAAGVDFSETGLLVRLSLPTSDAVRESLAESINNTEATVVLTTSSAVRLGLRHITVSAFPRLSVLSLNEISRDTQVEALGMVQALRRDQQIPISKFQ
jgi:flagellar biosynthesis protein FlhA